MQARKKTSRAKTEPKKAKKSSVAKSGGRTVSSAKARSKATTRRPVKKTRATKRVASPTEAKSAGTKASKKTSTTKSKSPRMKANAPAPRKIVRKTPRRAPQRPPREVEKRELEAETKKADDTPSAPHFELAREEVRGGFRDGMNHSKPEVQLQRQHVQTMRSPERRHTMRGH